MEDYIKALNDINTNQGVTYEEESLDWIKQSVMRRCKTEMIKYNFVEDVIIQGNKAIIKWKKRLLPLTKEEIKEKFGRDVG